MLDDDAPAVAALIATVEGSSGDAALQSFISTQLPLALWLAAATASSKALEVSCGACLGQPLGPFRHASTVTDTSIQYPDCLAMPACVCGACLCHRNCCCTPKATTGHGPTPFRPRCAACFFCPDTLPALEANTACGWLLVLACHVCDCSFANCCCTWRLPAAHHLPGPAGSRCPRLAGGAGDAGACGSLVPCCPHRHVSASAWWHLTCGLWRIGQDCFRKLQVQQAPSSWV